MSPSSSGSDPAALVTGGTRGIGRELAARLAAAGYRVLVCGRREPADLPPGVDFAAADVREPAEATALVAAATDAFGRLDLLVNNAGGSPAAPAATVSPNLVTAVVRLNLLAPFFVSQAANAVMQAQDGGGLIVNIGSVSAIRPAPGTAAYAAAKAGLETLTRALALEWAPKVRVNTVTAGVVRTDDNAAHYGDEAALAAVAATVPMGRMATPADIADAVLLLASPLAAYMTGASLLVDGGGQLPRYAETARPGGPGTG
ncbi:SDR family oxidoreductase [Dactylosporangium sp. NBC_01737]|uniref:SDR family oxidoreductase n=1 Tax=Dactylosporangium sp. NBC_01737 TaxID=2975959 RepID=UPI002E146423|nr:SDR family oxidoreductase [Dactylosporangium sp. NBC_01737]